MADVYLRVTQYDGQTRITYLYRLVSIDREIHEPDDPITQDEVLSAHDALTHMDHLPS